MSDYHLIIEAGKPHRQYVRDLWSYRELFLFLSWRDILVRYKQTIIGVAWSVLRPLLTMIVSLVDFVISFGILCGLMVVFRFVPNVRMLYLPLLLILAAITALGAGFWISALNVKYRDFRYVVPFMVQFGLYLSPVGFTSSVVPEKWRLLYSLNPMVGVIDGFRWAILGGEASLYWPGFALSIVLSLVLFVGGVLYFRRMEREFADVI
jgi:lipopolysaccharide transport system permease protein